jgi:paraquat-inducible protein A
MQSAMPGIKLPLKLFGFVPARLRTGKMPMNLVGCKTCGLVQAVEADVDHYDVQCSRCGELLRHNQPGSRARTAALSLAALFLYVPANIYPIIVMQYLGRETENTVWGGVKTLYQDRMWPLAALVFCASILIPLLKLIGLFFLVVNRGARWQRFRAAIFKLIGHIGPWAMLDVFLLAVMVGVIRFGRFATVIPGPGIMAFASVVVLTMLASASFDSRLIWNEQPSESHGK